MDDIAKVFQELIKIVRMLEKSYPGRKFTLDGHLLGSIGEVVAANRYGLKLLECSAEGHDAAAPDGRLVQIKVTQRNTIALRSEPKHLIVLYLDKDGDAQEIYNGPGAEPWRKSSSMQRNGQRPISLPKLRELMREVPLSYQLPIIVEELDMTPGPKGIVIEQEKTNHYVIGNSVKQYDKYCETELGINIEAAIKFDELLSESIFAGCDELQFTKNDGGAYTQITKAGQLPKISITSYHDQYLTLSKMKFGLDLEIKNYPQRYESYKIYNEKKEYLCKAFPYIQVTPFGENMVIQFRYQP